MSGSTEPTGGPRLRWGILATGLIARKFAEDLPGSRTGRLVAVGSRTLAAAERFARDFGVRAHGSYEALLADPEVQAVYIANPHPGHLEWALKAAAAGKHILCEKPLALNRADAGRMIAAARAAGVFLMEAFMYRCHPQARRVAELVRTGAIGRLQLITASFNVLCPFDPEHRMFKRELGGGAILDIGCYPVSYARLMAGAAAGRDFADPVEFAGTGRRREDTLTDDYAAAVARFPGGIVAQWSCGSRMHHHIRAELHGTDGWIEVPDPFTVGLGGKDAHIVLHRPGAEPEKMTVSSEGRGLYAHEADAVADAIAAGRQECAAMGWADTLGNLAVLDAWRAAVGVSYEGEAGG